MWAVEIGRVMPENVILARHELYVPCQDFELLAGLQQRRASGTRDGFVLQFIGMEGEEPNRGEKCG